VYGNWKAFKNEYLDFLSDEQIDVLERIEQFDHNFDKKRVDDILANNHVYLSSTIDEYQLPDFHNIVDNMKARIMDIKNNHYQLPMASDEDYKKQQKAIEDKQQEQEEFKKKLHNPIIQFKNPIIEIPKELEDINYATDEG
jgi:hypothetical protein